MRLGYASPARLIAQLRPSELGYWWALWCSDPWGEERADLRAAIGTSLLANVNRDRKKRAKPFLPEDFMPYRVKKAKRARAPAPDLGKRLLSAFGLTLKQPVERRP